MARLLRLESDKLFNSLHNNKQLISLGSGISSFFPKINNEYIPLSLQYANNIQGIDELRNAISLGYRSKLITKDNILVTSGATLGLFSTIKALVDNKSEVLIFEPCWSFYRKQIELCGAIPVAVKLELKNNWEINISDFKRKITHNTKAVIICSPNNPTGKIISPTIIKKIYTHCLNKGIYLIIDETYCDIAVDKKKDFVTHRLQSNQIIIRSFSKNLCLSGLRIGYVLATQKLIELIKNIHATICLFPSSYSQYFAYNQFKKRHKFIEINNKKYQKNLSILTDYLDKNKKIFQYVRPDGSFFIFVKIREEINAKKFCDDLLKLNVFIRSGEVFGEAYKNYVRISFNVSLLDLKKALSIIDNYIKEDE